MSLNRILLIGRLTKDPESRSTTNGQNICEFTIAVDRRFKPKNGDGQTADFFRVKAWGQSGSYITEYGGKGRLVSVEGRMESNKWQDREGNNRESWEVVADQVTLLDKPRED